MGDSLREQLLKSGLVSKLKAEARPPERLVQRSKSGGTSPGPAQQPARGRDRPPNTRPPKSSAERPARAPRSQDEIDLARAYAMRDRADREQRDLEKQQAEQRAREKAERKRQLATLLEGKALNALDADVARHFPHGEKIRRVYCTVAQLAEINSGELAVVQHLGRYLIVTCAVADQAAAINPDALVLRVDPDAPVEDDVPADLIW